MAGRLTQGDLHTLIGALKDAPNDARWSELAGEVGNPAVGPLLRAALGPSARAEAPAGNDDGLRNYLGEPLTAGNVVGCEGGVFVGPIDGLIGVSVRPVGARHSSSGVADGRPDGTLLDATLAPSEAALRRLDDGALRDGVDAAAYVRVPGGITLRDLNALLAAEQRALANLPAYMGLTVAGALSTGAHGSGAALGPLCDLVASITLVQADGRRVRVEPARKPITDAARWAALHPTALPLICDDRDFYAVVVGLGCMGVIDEVVLEVVPAFLLSEVHAASTWSQVKADLLARRFRAARHYEVLVSPYCGEGERDPICAVLTRELTDRVDRPLGLTRRPTDLAEMVYPGLGDALARAAGRWPWFATQLARGVVEVYGRNPDGAAHDGDGPRVGGASYDVLDVGGINRMKGVATEIAFVLPDGDPTTLIAAVDALLARAAEQLTRGGWVHTLPISLRFTQASPHLLAMSYGKPACDFVCTVEMLALRDVDGYDRALDAFQEASLGVGRPHWGQRNDRMRDPARLPYPELDRWRAVRAERDPDGRFGNAMTDAFGLTPPRVGAHIGRSGARPSRAPAGASRDVENRFFLPCGADDFAARFLALKSTETRFGPLDLIRAEGRAGKAFVVGERFEGRMRLDRNLRAALLRSPLPDGLERPFESLLRTWPADRAAAWFASLFASNHCRLTTLRTGTTPAGTSECEYEFLPGSPVTGSIRFTVTGAPGGCLVTHRLRYEPVGPLQRAFMNAVGLRLSLVVAYVEVAMAARSLGVGMATDLRRPTDLEACHALPPSTRVLALDPAGVVAIKRDVRRFDVAASADAFARAFHEALSTAGRFDFFSVDRGGVTRPFQRGDRFAGVMTLTPALAAELRALRLPPDLDGPVGRALAAAAEALLMAYFRHDPPTDYGVITALEPAVAPRFVRYDYLEGTPIAGYSTFEVEDRGPGACRVTQTFVYQEQRLAIVEVFGTLGLYLHNRVVAAEIAHTAGALGVGWEALDP